MQELSTDIRLIDQLRKEDAASYEQLYRLYFPTVAQHIRRNSGGQKDAEDIFQDTVMVLVHNIRQPEFILTSSLKTYLFSISKNLWLKKLRENKRMPASSEETFTDIPVLMVEDEATIHEEQVLGWLQKITLNCQRILKAIFYLNEPMESLMNKMGWKNKHSAANQKYKCIEQIRKESRK